MGSTSSQAFSFVAVVLFGGASFAACGGQVDNGVLGDDGGSFDAIADSVAHLDAGAFDGGSRDATSFDAGSRDATSIDARSFDAGFDASFDASIDVLSPDTGVDTGTSDAGTPLFDSLSAESGASTRNAGDSCGTQIVVHATTTISGMSVKNTLSTSGNIKFLIFDNGAVVYASAPKPFSVTTESWKDSDAFSFTFQAGRTYDVTGISDVAGTWSYDTVVENTAAISSTIQNPNLTNFVTPVLGARGGADCGVRLYP